MKLQLLDTNSASSPVTPTGRSKRRRRKRRIGGPGSIVADAEVGDEDVLLYCCCLFAA